MTSLPHRIRDAVSTDHALVLDSWRKSLRETRKRSEIDAGFSRAHRAIAETLIAECTMVVGVPLDEEGADLGPDAISGWAIGEPLEEHLLVHYVYVKNVYRRGGLARAMLAELVGRVQRNGRSRDGKPHLPQIVLTACTEKWIGNRMRRERWGFLPNVPYYRAICRMMDRAADEATKGTAA
jgi:GNAT superfamily N-acetyltransferase